MTAARREPALVALIVAACAAGIWVATRSSYFAADDWLNFGLAREYGLSWAYLKLSYVGHFAPVHRVLDWIWSTKLQGDWSAYLALMLVLHAVASCATYVLARALGCRVALAAAATALFASSVVWVRIIQWPASAEHVAWALAATAVSLAAAMLWFSRRSPWLLALSAAAMVAGLLSYEKPVLIVLYVVLLRYFVLAPSLRPRALLAQARADWPLLATLGGVAAAYAAVVVVGDYSSTDEHPSTGELAEFFSRSWFRGTGALAIGQGSPEYASPIPTWLVIAAQLVLAAALIVSVRRRPRAWRAWAFLAICWVVNLAPIGINRAATFGTGVGQDPRYQAEMALILPLALALAFAPGPAARPTGARRPDLRQLALAGAALALLVASCVSSYRRTERSWQGSAARQWVERAQQTAPAFRGPDGRVSVIDAPAPIAVIGINSPPYSLQSTVLPIVLDDRVDFDGRGARPAILAEDGALRPARLERVWGGRLPRPVCGPSVVRRRVTGVRGAPPALVRATGITTRRPAQIGALADNGAGLFPLPSAVRAEPAVRASGTFIDPRRLRAVELRLPAGVCVGGLTIATAG